MINIKEVLKHSKLKITPARVSILEVFNATPKPLTADMIAQKIKTEKINLVTIYRTIESLLKFKIISRVDLRQDSVYYELAHMHHHHHLVCRNCGLVEDFELCSIKSLEAKILGQSKKFKSITEHSLELFGICKVCKS